MGYWGSGVYQNDQALDIVNELCLSYIKEVESSLQEATSWDDSTPP
jgi:hypothetical protein